MVGYLVQQRRIYVAHLRDRAATDAVTRERLRIARELHDVVAHSMTVVTVQAGFGEYVFDSQPAEARAALGAIQAVSREALGEMQRMLCVLRQTDGDIAAADAALAQDPAAAGTSATGITASGGRDRQRDRRQRDRRTAGAAWRPPPWPRRRDPRRTGPARPRTGSGPRGPGPPRRWPPRRGWPTWTGWWSGPPAPGSR